MNKKHICDKVRSSVGWGRDPERKDYCSINKMSCSDPFKEDCYYKKFDDYRLRNNIGGNYLK